MKRIVSIMVLCLSALFTAPLLAQTTTTGAVGGVISDPHDRYGSRIVWIAAFGIGLAVWRAVIFALKRATVVASESASTA